MQLFLSQKERLILGSNGGYPNSVIEVDADGSQKKDDINEKFTRPWIKHHFLTQLLDETGSSEAIEARDKNLIDILKTTIPLTENSYIETQLTCWKQFLDNSFATRETQWYAGLRKIFIKENFHTAVEQFEIDIPSSHNQTNFLFLDETRLLRRLPRIPIKLFFSISPKYLIDLFETLKLSVVQNPHNREIEQLMYLFYKGFDNIFHLMEYARQINRYEYVEWIYWAENNTKTLGDIKRSENDYNSAFFCYDTANLSPSEFKEIAEWYMAENEFKLAFHFYYKAKAFQIAQDILQNIGVKEYGALVALRQLAGPANGEPTDANIKTLYEQELEALQGFNRILSNESYQKIASVPTIKFDRETVENKYAFGELTDEEYMRLIAQLRDRRQ